MSGMADSISNFFYALSSTAESRLSDEGTANRAKAKEVFETMKEVCKVAAIVSALAAAVLCVFFVPTGPLIGLLLAAGIAFCAREITQFANNGLEIHNNPAIEVQVRMNNKALADQLSKDTFIVRPIINLIHPELKS